MEELNPACRIKTKRKRRTRDEMVDFRADVRSIVETEPPMTVRQVFYRAVAFGLIEKTENGYDQIGDALLHLRRSGAMPWHWITDATRWRHKSKTYTSAEAALRATADFYRRSLWMNQVDYVEIWLEKDTLSGVVWPVVSEFDVPLMVSRGFTSETYLYEAARDIVAAGRPAFLYYLGDRDPSGVLIDQVIERKLRGFASGAEINFERIAVTPAQIEQYSLPTRPTKRGKNSHAKNFQGDSVEVDAIPPNILRQIVRDRIESHIDPRGLEVCRAVEQSEREILTRLAESLTGRN